MSAHKMSTEHGYVVVWQDGHNVMPLKCFGDYQSAAIEFCNILNKHYWEKKDYQIKAWAKSFNPAEKYTYPQLTKLGVTLRRQ